MLRAGLLFVALSALVACETQVDPAVLAAPKAVPTSASAAPGDRAVSVSFGADIVQKACIDARPSFQSTPDRLAAIGGFVRKASTGTNFHSAHDLSVKLVPGRCSVVMGGQFPANAAAQALNRVAPSSAARAGRTRMINGTTFLSFFVSGG